LEQLLTNLLVTVGVASIQSHC